MLVLGRKEGEGITLHWGGEMVRVIVSRDGVGRTRLAIEAPRHIRVVRDELPDTSRLSPLEPVDSD